MNIDRKDTNQYLNSNYLCEKVEGKNILSGKMIMPYRALKTN